MMCMKSVFSYVLYNSATTEVLKLCIPHGIILPTFSINFSIKNPSLKSPWIVQTIPPAVISGRILIIISKETPKEFLNVYFLRYQNVYFQMYAWKNLIEIPADIPGGILGRNPWKKKTRIITQGIYEGTPGFLAGIFVGIFGWIPREIPREI